MKNPDLRFLPGGAFARTILPIPSVSVCFLVLLVSLLAGGSRAGEPLIESMSTPVVQQGTEFELKLEGSGFLECKKLVFYSPEIRCLNVQVDSDYELIARIQVDSGCEPIAQPFRVLSKFGFSDLRTVRVTPFPIVFEDKEEMTKVTSLEGRTCVGTLEAGDIDEYSLDLSAGTAVSIEVEAIRLGLELLDTVLFVTAPDGKQLLRIDDDALFQQDPVASFVAPEDGRYVVSVHEANYQGGLSSHYALHIGAFPRPGVLYPAGGRFGEKLTVSIIGDGGRRDQQVVALPKREDAAGFQFRPQAGGQVAVPTALPFRLGELASQPEQEPNESPDQVTSFVECPIALDGIIDSPKDLDWFHFQMPASLEPGQAYRVELFADRIGSPIDGLLELYTDAGEFVAANDDWGSHDSRIEYYPVAGQRYALRVSDKLGGGVPNGVYRVEIRPIKPQLTAFLPRPDRVSQASQVVSVPRGNRSVKLVAVKREYVDGEVLLQFLDLPPGVSASPVFVPEDQYWVPAVLQADSAAPDGGASLPLVQVPVLASVSSKVDFYRRSI